MAEQMLTLRSPVATDCGTATDRRRPGRQPEVHPQLIPLLRQPTGETQPDGDSILFDGDDLAPARGVLIGGVVSAAIWAGIALLLMACGTF